MAGQQAVRRRLANDQRAGRRQEALPPHVRGSNASHLLASGNHKHHAGRTAKLGRELHSGGDERRHAALHIAAAASVNLAVRDCPAERLDAPGDRAERHHVHMPCKGQRQLAAAAANARDEVLAAGAQLDDSASRKPAASRMGPRWRAQSDSLPGGLMVLKRISSWVSVMGEIMECSGEKPPSPCPLPVGARGRWNCRLARGKGRGQLPLPVGRGDAGIAASPGERAAANSLSPWGEGWGEGVFYWRNSFRSLK